MVSGDPENCLSPEPNKGERRRDQETKNSPNSSLKACDVLTLAHTALIPICPTHEVKGDANSGGELTQRRDLKLGFGHQGPFPQGQFPSGLSWSAAGPGVWLCPFVSGPALPLPCCLCSEGLFIFIATTQPEKNPQEPPDPSGKGGAEDHPRGHLPQDTLAMLSGSVSRPGMWRPAAQVGQVKPVKAETRQQ